MIWARDTELDHRQDLYEQVLRDFQEADPDLPQEAHGLEELAGAVVEYCDQRFGEGAVPSEYYGLILSRALWSVGRDRSAEKVLQRWCSDDAAALCTPLEPVGGRTRLWPLCRAGLVRSGNWLSVGAPGGWIIDLGKMTIGSSSALELVIHETLLRLLPEMVHVWDARGGEGWLGLQGVREVEREIYGRSGTKAGIRLRRELLGCCRGCLAQCREARAWRQEPEVRDLSI
jgi:hypothetical protein